MIRRATSRKPLLLSLSLPGKDTDFSSFESPPMGSLISTRGLLFRSLTLFFSFFSHFFFSFFFSVRRTCTLTEFGPRRFGKVSR